MLKGARIFFVLLLLTTVALSNSDTSIAALEKQADGLRTKLKDRGFTVIVEKPFIVIGDEPQPLVRRWAEGIVRGTVARLKQDYFTKDPANILEIWLFKDAASYNKHA